MNTDKRSVAGGAFIFFTEVCFTAFPAHRFSFGRLIVALNRRLSNYQTLYTDRHRVMQDQLHRRASMGGSRISYIDGNDRYSDGRFPARGHLNPALFEIAI
jgi:hypothetical protein